MANTNELLLGWAGRALDALEAKLQGQGSASLEALFGTREVNEMRATAAAPALTRAAGQRPNIVLLPGIMGSLLQSVEGLVELLWVNPLVFTRGLINLLELADDGETDANPRVKIVATGLEMMSYAKATLMLRKQANPFLFPYDWRRDIRTAAGLLHQALNRWAASNGYRRFTLVSHSMGGLVSRTYLALFPEEAERLVERVILLGSPAYGIVNAVQNLTTGNDLMQLAHKLNDDNQGDRLVRSITALYQLLPPPPDLFPAGRQYPCDFDLYDAAAAWSPPFIPPNGGGKRGGNPPEQPEPREGAPQTAGSLGSTGADHPNRRVRPGNADCYAWHTRCAAASGGVSRPQQRRWRRAPLVGNPAGGGDVLRASRPR